ncbi:hypothetical protein M0813_00667 [Anaeramoeba flamelloides]|uniref:Endo-beta-1,2-glucanase SGL domain-containing protein n=1 Tax=Anaeramoeba flamelloides TaxID=1746091 RepID=A0ABQ8XQK3_9EUKA|nr:hypothetical protein M0813_00667 [Anaeramoeba flamelloides]
MKTKFLIILLFFVAINQVICNSKFSNSKARSKDSCCRFTKKYTPSLLQTSKEALLNFFDDFKEQELKFVFGEGISHAKSGITYDGINLNAITGEIEKSSLHFWSAASKECLHISILIQLLQEGSELYPKKEIITIMERKIASYEEFNQKYPGYGGHLPWVYVNDSGMIPANGWWDRTPSLDNGEMFWSMYAATEVLSNIGELDLADRYSNWINLMAKSSKMMFWNGTVSKIRTLVKIRDIYSPPSANNQYSQFPCTAPPCFLDDPYEGELYAWILQLMSNQLSSNEIEQMWANKRKKLQLTQYQSSQYGPVSAIKGWWYSAHEKWKCLLMPYLDNALFKRIFITGEKARMVNSAELKICGMFASSNRINCSGYVSATGIQQLSFETVSDNIQVTPYSTFPSFLLKDLKYTNYSATWLYAMLSGYKMQSQYGSVEAIDLKGQNIANTLTWDAKITTLVALNGGIYGIVSEKMAKDGIYQAFIKRIQLEYSRILGDKGQNIVGENIPFSYPKSFFTNTDSFPSCDC